MFPNLDHVKEFSFDIETYDPGIKKLGPGPRRDGYIVGASIAVEDNQWYFPFRHPRSQNVDTSKFFEWLGQYRDKNIILAKATYDLDYAHYQGYEHNGYIFDILIAEALLSNNFKINLDSCAEKYIGKHKSKDVLKDYCDRMGWKGEPVTHIYKMPASVAQIYGADDARYTFDVFQKQKSLLKSERVAKVFAMESKLIPLLLQMLHTGVRIDEEKLEKNIAVIKSEIDRLEKDLYDFTGFEFNVNSPKQMKIAYDRLGYAYPTISEYNKITREYTDIVTFRAVALEADNSDLGKKIVKLRQYRKVDSAFLTGMKKHIINGRIHCQFNSSGAETGRFSSSNPNLQNQPSRDELTKSLVRGLFIPEEGQRWLRNDYSQIELRCLAHFAVGSGAEEIRQEYTANPDIDYHDMCSKISGKPRKAAKTITFGVTYGQGNRKLSRALGVSIEQAKMIKSMFFQKLPFLQQTFRQVEAAAQQQGYIRTILGRKRRIDKNHYRALNTLLQGTAAEVMKSAMVDAYEAGIYNVLTPHVTVHDEMDQSMPDTKEAGEAVKEMKHIYENTIKLKVPVLVDFEIGSNWAELEEYQV